MATAKTAKSTQTTTAPAKGAQPVRSYNGAEILVEGLIREGTEYIFAYPGGCSMPLHQALIKAQDRIRTLLPRHEQGGAFAAQGIARATKTLRNVKSAWIKEQRVDITGDSISEYQVNLVITFVLDD